MKRMNWVPVQGEHGAMWQLGGFPRKRYTRGRRQGRGVRLREDFDELLREAQVWRGGLGATGRIGGAR